MFCGQNKVVHYRKTKIVDNFFTFDTNYAENRAKTYENIEKRGKIVENLSTIGKTRANNENKFCGKLIENGRKLL